jgi:hypothetical protein
VAGFRERFSDGARYHFMNHFCVGASYEFLEDDGRWGANARFSF